MSRSLAYRPSPPTAAITVFLCLTLVAATTFADTSAQTQLPSFGDLLVQVTFSLLVIATFAYLLVRFGLSRFQRRAEDGHQMNVIERLPIDARRSILMIKVRDRVLVVGLSEAGFSRLAEFDDHADLDDATPPTEADPGDSFNALLDDDPTPSSAEV